MATPDSIGATATPGWASFPKTATYRPSPAARRVLLGLVPLLLSCATFFWPLVFDGSRIGAGSVAFLLAVVVLIVLGACVVRYVLNLRFELEPRSITVHGLRDEASLPLSQVAALTARRQRRSRTWLIALHPTHGAASRTIRIEDRDLDDADLFAWLASIPRRGGDPVLRSKPIARMSRGSRIVVGLIAFVLLPAVWLLVSGPVDTARALVAGYPPLDQLSRVEGMLTSVGGCRAAGRGHAATVPVTIATATGPVAESLDCDFASTLRAAPQPHHGRRLARHAQLQRRPGARDRCRWPRVATLRRLHRAQPSRRALVPRRAIDADRRRRSDSLGPAVGMTTSQSQRSTRHEKHPRLALCRWTNATAGSAMKRERTPRTSLPSQTSAAIIMSSAS